MSENYLEKGIEYIQKDGYWISLVLAIIGASLAQVVKLLPKKDKRYQSRRPKRK